MNVRALPNVLALLSLMGMLLQPAAMAAAPRSMATDISLRDGGELVGQILNGEGVSQAATNVSVYRNGKPIAQVATNQHGVFSVPGLKGGVYTIATADHQGVYRLWAPRTAPPAAQQGLMIVSGNQVVRGQGSPFSRVTGWITEHPICTAGIVAAAIAIPIAIDNDNDSSS